MAVVHGSISWWHFALVGIWIFCNRASAMDLAPLEKLLGDAVLLSLTNARITVKEAAAFMQFDESQLRKCLRGDPMHHMSLTRLIRLPYSFWLHFSPALIYLVAKRSATEIAEDMGIRKSA